MSANSTSFCLYGRFDIKHIYFPYIFENLTIPLRINLISVNNSGVYNDSVVHVYNDYHNSYYRLNYSKNFFNGNFKIKDRLHITFDSMDETILIIYFPINLFLKYYEIIKKPQKKIIPKSNYLIFQFDDDFISFANLKIYSKANSKVSIFRYNGDDSKDIIGNHKDDNVIKFLFMNYLNQGSHYFSEDIKDLIGKLLKRSPNERISIEEVKAHPWITKNAQKYVIK